MRMLKMTRMRLTLMMLTTMMSKARARADVFIVEWIQDTYAQHTWIALMLITFTITTLLRTLRTIKAMLPMSMMLMKLFMMLLKVQKMQKMQMIQTGARESIAISVKIKNTEK